MAGGVSVDDDCGTVSTSIGFSVLIITSVCSVVVTVLCVEYVVELVVEVVLVVVVTVSLVVGTSGTRGFSDGRSAFDVSTVAISSVEVIGS